MREGELRATRLRLALGVLGCIAVGLLWQTNTQAVSLATLALGGAYTGWAARSLHRARQGRPVRAWAHAMVDQLVVAGASAVSTLNHSGGYEALLAPLFPLLHAGWIGLAALHYAVTPPLVAGGTAAALRAAVVAWVVGSGKVVVAPTATYGERAIGLADQWTIVACLGLAGVAAAWVAASSRNLLVRAARDAMERTQLARAQASTKVDLTLTQANEASYRAAFKYAPAGLALLSGVPSSGPTETTAAHAAPARHVPPALRIFRANRALGAMLGWRPEDLEGRPLSEVIVGDTLPDAALGRDLVLRRRDGTLVTTRASMTLAPDTGALRCFVAQFVVPELAPATPGPRAGSTPLSGARVLVADDDDDLREWMTSILRSSGATVRGAGSTTAAGLQAATQLDAAVIDVQLPAHPGEPSERDAGVTLAHALALAHPGIRVVLVSGAAPDAPVPFPVLVKPFPREALIARLVEGRPANAST